jgi:hypothetical protein
MQLCANMTKVLFVFDLTTYFLFKRETEWILKTQAAKQKITNISYWKLNIVSLVYSSFERIHRVHEKWGDTVGGLCTRRLKGSHTWGGGCEWGGGAHHVASALRLCRVCEVFVLCDFLSVSLSSGFCRTPEPNWSSTDCFIYIYTFMFWEFVLFSVHTVLYNAHNKWYLQRTKINRLLTKVGNVMSKHNELSAVALVMFLER